MSMRPVRTLLPVTLILLVIAALLPPARGAEPAPIALAPIAISANTGEKPQSKVWYHSSTWWAVVPTSAASPGAGTWVWRLEAAGTWTPVLQLSTRTDTHADVKSLASGVAHVLLHGSAPELVSVEYVAATHTYQGWSARPAATPLSLANSETATIDVDSTGRLWLSTESTSEVHAYYADSPYSSFSGPVVIATGIDGDDISVVTAMPGSKVGVLWSNQVTKRFGFKVHVDGADPNTWSADEIPASQSALNVGLGMADDHLNVKVGSDGTLYAAVKTSYDTAGYPKVALLVRRPSGVWDNLYEVSQTGTRGIVLLDEVHGFVRVVYTSSEGFNDILYKESPLSAISFTGPAQTLISGGVNDVTSTKQNWSGRVVVMASSASQASSVLITRGDPSLVGYWRMDETGGLTAFDASGFASDGTLQGNAARGAGESGEAVVLDGTGDYVSVPNARHLNASNAITVAAWVKPGRYRTQDLVKKAVQGSVDGFELSLATTKTDSTSQRAFFRLNQFSAGPPSGDLYRASALTEYPIDGTWMHLAGTYDGTSVKLYVNGVLETTVAGPTTLGINDQNLAIGAQPDGTRTLLGSIDDVRIYNRALSAAEIANLVAAPQADLSITKTDNQSAVVAGSDVTYVIDVANSFGPTAVTAARVTDTLPAFLTGATWTCSATIGSTCSASGTGSINDTINLAVGGNATYVVHATVSASATGTLVNTASVAVPGGYIDPVGGNNSATDSDTITPAAVNQPPVVGAGTDRVVTLPSPATLAGTATDDGLPGGGLTTAWSQVSGPGTALFADATALLTTATFPLQGTYVLRLTASDGALSSSDDLTVTVLASLSSGLVGYWRMDEGSGTTLVDSSGAGNNAAITGTPTWTAGKVGLGLNLNGGDQYAIAPSSTSLNMTGAITMAAWVRPTKPAFATQNVFKRATSTGASTGGYELSLASTGKVFVRLSNGTLIPRIDSITSYPLGGSTWMHIAATYDGAGSIRLYVNGIEESSTTVTGLTTLRSNTIPLGIGVEPNSPTYSSKLQGQLDEARIYNRALTVAEIRALMNLAPVVNAGLDQAITLPATASLAGAVTDDGLPTAPPTSRWEGVSGPGTVTFANPASLSTTASFSVAGTYVLRLTGDDGMLTGSDDVTVTVNPAVAVNQPPVVDAGPDQAVRVSAGASLAGTATDDGLPSGTLTTAWSLVTGPGIVAFANPSALSTTATFSTTGTYVLRLSASDGVLATPDTMTVTVRPDLVGLWPFEEGSGPALLDLSEWTNSGTLVGSPSWVAGMSGQALRLNGTTQYGLIPHAESLNLTKAITLAAWVKAGRCATQDVIKKAVNGSVNGFELSLATTTSSWPCKVFFRVNQVTSGDSYRANSTSVYPIDGTWMHVAGTYDGANMRLYFNGVLQDTVAGPASIATNTLALGIGGQSDGAAARLFQGDLDDARVYGRALTETEIKALANRAPVVSAGADQAATLPAAASLAGSVTDDGLPSASVTSAWTQMSGPGTATFASPASPSTTATFSAAGTYVLRLTGDDGMSTASDEVTVTVNPSAPVNLPPAVPTLVAPTNGATNVTKPPTLSVQVSDTDSANLTVKFYGRPKSSVTAGPDFTVVVLPDTQNYTASLSGGTPAMFTSQTDWIVANALSRNIAYVAHVGDVTNDNNATQWGYANTSLNALEQSLTGLPFGVPYGVSIGNHDGSPSSTSLFNQYFGTSRFAGRPYYGGFYGTDNDNHYDLFSAGGLDFIVVHLEYPPPTAVLDWADALLKTYSSRRAIIVTHDLIGTGNPGAFSANGQPIYDALKDNPNVVLMLAGHTPGEGRRSDVFGGNTIHALLADYQSVSNGGNGWMRILEFSPASSEIRVKTYSPVLGQWDTDATSQFTLPYAMSSTAAFELLGETTVASGATASFSWPGRADGTEYEWYATVSDLTTTVTSSTWSFTTAAAAIRDLSVARTGTGSGSVTSLPAGIDCGATCGASYAHGTEVTLTAAPAAGSTFTGWSGACTGTGSCIVTMDAAKAVTATFSLNSYALTASKSGTGFGTVTSVPAGIDCGATCGASYDYNTVVTLTATPAMGSSFAGWSGAGCTGTGTCVVTMGAAQAVTATFTLNSYTLTVTKVGAGSGSVTSTPAGINCPGDCAEAYTYATSVTLTAAAAAGSKFSGWSGACTGTADCVVTMSAAQAATATFALNTTYYVDNTNASCSDAGAGTSPSLPFCTLTKGANTAVAGDTVRVLAGTYAEVVKPNSGTPGNLVTFSANPGVTVTGPPGNSTNGGAFRIWSGSYIVVDGFLITGTADYGIILDSSNHITISNNHVSYSGTASIHKIGIYLRTTTDSIITGNTTDHNTMDGIRLNTGSNYNTVSNNTSFGNAESTVRNACGINVLASNYNTIIHNVVYANEDTGLNFYTGSSYNLVVGNLTYGNGDHGIDNNAAPNNVFIGNTVQGNVTVGINIEGASSPGSGGATVINNVMVDNGLLRLVGGGISGGSAGNIRVDAQSLVGTTLDYNLYYLSPAEGGTAQIYWGGGSAYPSLAAFQAAQPTQEAHGLQADPRLAAPAPPGQRPPAAPFNVAINVGDYHLTSGSAAIDSANSNAPSQAAFDIEGRARFDDVATTDTGAGVRTYDDRGAYEFVGYALTVTKDGTGTGSVTSLPAGIDCGVNCSKTYTHDTVVTLTATPAVGSAFAGWSGAGCSGTGSCLVTIDAAKAVTATFTLNSYTLTYTAVANGSITGTSPQTVAHGESGTAVTAVPDTGYHFISWSDGGLTPARTDTNVTANVSVSASFAINQYAVTFDANGGTGSMAVQARNYSDAANLTASTFSRTGYTFAGWNTVANGSGTSYADQASYGFTASVTLFARWTINSYTVTFDANGGTGSMAVQTRNYNDAASLTANGFSRTGYAFAGWNTAANGAGTTYADQASYGFTASVTLYAKWTAVSQTLTFASNGGTPVTAITQDIGTAVSAPAAPTRTGYTFGGWFTDDGTFLVAYTFPHTMGLSTTVYAKWTAGSETLTFNSNGGTPVTAITQDFGTAVSAPTNPTRTGFTFGGWFTDDGTFLVAYTFPHTMGLSTTVYAKWTAGSETLTFNSNGGTPVTAITQDFGTSVSAPANPTRTGYAFGGWFTDDGTFLVAYTFPHTMGLSTTVYAKWTAVSQTLTFASNGGTPVTAITQDFGTSVSAPAAPTRTGYTFGGWFTDDGTFLVAYTFPHTMGLSTTVYAKWTAGSETLTFNSNGGTPVTAITQDFGTSVSAPANPTRTGYAFGGWFTDDGTFLVAYTFPHTMGLSTTVYAKWTAVSQTLTFASNGGTPVTAITQDFGTAVSASTNPTRTGYAFGGWFTDDGTFLVAYTFPHTMGLSTTVYAQWAVNQYSVTFDANGGTGSMATQTRDYNVATNLTANAFSRTGYAFAGWNTAANGSGTTYADQASYGFTASVTLYAQWTINSYTVTFDANGGTGSMSAQSATYNVATALTANTFSRAGYAFAGWNTVAVGGGTAYADGASYPFTASVTLYAQWTINSYTVSFNSNGGTSVTSQLVAYNGLATAPADPTKAGNTFAGWYRDAGLTSGFAFSTAITADLTLYAKWTIRTYTLTYTAGAHGSLSGTASQTVNHGASGSLVTAVSDAGYHFVSWSDGALTAARTDTNVTANLSVSATFALNSYALSVTRAGTGTGSVTSTPTGINCGVDCGETYGHGQAVTLTATPAVGSTFTGWSGACTGTGTCIVTMDAAKTVTATFAAAGAGPSVQLLAPNGGNKLLTNSAYLITWNATAGTAALASFSVQYSRNNGASFSTVPGCTSLGAAIRQCTWARPVATSAGRIRVVATDAAARTGSDTSDAAFSVVSGTASVSITSPNNDTMVIGTVEPIRWNHNVGTSSFAATFTVEVSRNGSNGPWEVIAANVPQVTATTGRFDWTVVGPTSDHVHVRVRPTSFTASDNSGNLSIESPMLALSYPQNAQTLIIGRSSTIRWNTNLSNSDTVKIEVSRNGGLTWELIASAVVAGDDRYTWRVTGPATTQLRVRVTWNQNPTVSSASIGNNKIR